MTYHTSSHQTQILNFSNAVKLEMTGDDVCLNGIVKQEEDTCFMGSPLSESSEWTDEKHSLYLKSMETSFVDSLYNSLDMQCWQAQNECSSDSMSARKIQAITRCPSGQFKVFHRGYWSRVDFNRENQVPNVACRSNVSSSNLWIQHFRNGKKKPSITSYSNTEVIDQNFVEEDSAIQLMNTACSKKRKGTYAAPESGNDQAALSFGHFSCNRNS